jgi:toxin ParE1/3/4
MAREVEWTVPAWEDLEAAADYIARDSQTYAAIFVQEVKDAASSLTEFAERGQVVPEFGDKAIRELLVSPYRLVYTILKDKVVILALVHGAQRLWRL